MVSYSYDCYVSVIIISLDDITERDSCVRIMHKECFRYCKTAVFSIKCIIRIMGAYDRELCACVYVYIHYAYNTCVFFTKTKTRL